MRNANGEVIIFSFFTRRRRAGGYLLPFALALMVIFITLVAALHHSEAVSRHSLTAAEADLRLIESTQWELANVTNRLPAKVTVPGFTVTGNTHAIANGTTVGNTISDRLFDLDGDGAFDGYPNLNVPRGEAINNNPPPHSVEYQSRPGSTSLKDYGTRTWRVVTTDTPLLAAYAPQGNITLDEVRAWANPAFGTAAPTNQTTGLPVTIYGGKAVNVADFPYGQALSAQSVRIERGLAVPLVGQRLGERPYASELVAVINSFKTLMEADAKASSDVTKFIDDPVPGPKILLGEGSIDQFLSLNSSLNFPFPSLPMASMYTVPMTYFSALFWFHAPFPPEGSSQDTSMYDSVKALNEQLTQVKEKLATLDEIKRRFEGAEPVPAQGHSPAQPGCPGLLNFDKVLGPLKSKGEPTQALLQWVAEANVVVTETAKAYDDKLLSQAYQPVAPLPASGGNTTYTEAEINNIILKKGMFERTRYDDDKGSNPTFVDKEKHVAQLLNQPDYLLTAAVWDSAIFHVDPYDFDPKKTTSVDTYKRQLAKMLENTSDPNNPYARAQQYYRVVEKDYAKLKDEQNQIIAKITAAFADMKAKGDSQVPQTRNEEIEKKVPKKGGIEGYAYAPYGYSYDVVYNLIEKGINGGLIQSWPTVFFGHRGKPQLIQHMSGFQIKATLTVPPGRTFYYANSLTVLGDLWLQRGATLVIASGDLLVTNPSDESVNATAPAMTRYNVIRPCGRIILEEGSNLIVNGDVTCVGTAERGSVVVCGPSKGIHPITSSILCTGSVRMPWGTLSGVRIDDLIAESGKVGAGFVKYGLRPLLQDLCPNLAKAVGPFHRRRAFFSSKAPQWLFTIVIGPFGIPIPVVAIFPVPPKNNMLVTVYTYVSMFYSVLDNAGLGEYLYPQADWWPLFGQDKEDDGAGAAIVIPKVDIAGAFNDIQHFTIDFDLAKMSDFVIKYVEQLGEKMLDYLKNQLIKTVISKVIAALFGVPIDSLVDQVMNQITDFEKSLDDDTWSKKISDTFRSEVNKAIGKIITKLADENLSPYYRDMRMREVSGLLVYAGQKMNIGHSGTTDRALVASGLFLAGSDLVLNTEYTVGSLVSFNGSINPPTSQAHTRLYSYPYFGAAFPHVLQSQTGSSWLQRAVKYRYGTNLSNSGNGKYLSPPRNVRVTAEGWAQ